MIRKLGKILTFAASALLLSGSGVAGAAEIPQDAGAAVVLVYQRVGEDQYPDTSVSADKFAGEVEELTAGGYNVMKLPDIVAALKDERGLPPKTVAITFDGGHRSVLDNAVPLLLKNNLPFTLFVSPGRASDPSAQYIHWDDFRRLARNDDVSFGLHPPYYARIQDKDVLAQINSARAAFREQMKLEPALFAYPFGEYNLAYRNLVEKQGFDAAFGEQSGVLNPSSDMFAIPRFTVTEAYGGVDRFRMIAGALPLPVTEITPADPQLATPQPNIGFTLDQNLVKYAGSLSCFAAGSGKADIQLIGPRVELRLQNPFTDDRARINCTMPATEKAPDDDDADEQRWRWFGMLMTVPVQKTAGSDDAATLSPAAYSSPAGD
jgi:peptidoglycan/xylan/chitin deacetylase (PgdA/CDA1 family)